MRKLRILVLMHESLVPPEPIEELKKKDVLAFRTEYDVVIALKRMGHEVRSLGVRYELLPIRKAVEEWKPHIVFNLLEEFRDEAIYDQHMVAYLELLGVPYTGCNPRGLVLSRDKALSKKILTYHRIRTPGFASFPKRRKPKRPKRLTFPLIVKSLNEEASRGIAEASVVDSDEKLEERVRFIHERIKTDAIAEQFIEGRELYVSVLGNSRLQLLPVWELLFKNKPEGKRLINTAKAKWDPEYIKKWGIDHGPAGLTDELAEEIERISKRIYRRLGLAGYARLDFRLDAKNRLYFLEANPNPDIAAEEEMSLAAKAAGLDYSELLQKVVNLGLRR